MLIQKWILSCVLLCIAVIGGTNSYKILGVFPTMLKSHYFVGSSLMKSLAEKGHEVTMISPFPQKTSLKNFRDIVTPKVVEIFKGFDNNTVSLRDNTYLESLMEVYSFGLAITTITLAEPSMQQLMASGEKFDVIVCEVFLNDALFGLAELFNAPLIGVSPFGSSLWTNDLVGTPSPLSYMPSDSLPYSQHMTLFQRIHSLFYKTIEHLSYEISHLPAQERLFKKHFPNSKLGLQKIRKNTALVLLNSHVSLGRPRPYMPNMIEVGGLHIDRQVKPLPADLKRFLDDAKDGAIFFSMGSGLKSSSLAIEKRDAILRTFKLLKQKVLWKFEDKNLPGKSDNVLIRDWFPQQEILAHPNVKMFITHGGLLSTLESIYVGKPFVGIPMFGDQHSNMGRSQDGGYAITVDYEKLSFETFSTAINEMLNNPKYATQMKITSERYRDQPREPMELATYWVEYVARHNGAPHLHCAGQDLDFIQYHNIDAILVLLGGVLVVVLAVCVILFKIFVRLFIQKKKLKVKTK